MVPEGCVKQVARCKAGSGNKAALKTTAGPRENSRHGVMGWGMKGHSVGVVKSVYRSSKSGSVVARAICP